MHEDAKNDGRRQLIDHGADQGEETEAEDVFFDGESCRDVEARLRSFISECLNSRESIAIVSHRFPQLALEVILNGRDWPNAIQHDWRNEGHWQPGWEYRLEEVTP